MLVFLQFRQKHALITLPEAKNNRFTGTNTEFLPRKYYQSNPARDILLISLDPFSQSFPIFNAHSMLQDKLPPLAT